MITHILRTALNSGLFTKIHVSTEDEKIQRVATEFGFPPDFSRPNELADDQTPIMPVMRYVTGEYLSRGEEFDQVWLLMACAPLITPLDLAAAASLSEKFKNERKVLAVGEYPVPIEWAFDRDRTGELSPVQPGMFAQPSQQLPKRYFDAGAFAIFPSNSLLDSTFAGSDTGFIGFELPKSSVVDIDDLKDWELAEKLFRSQTEN